MKSDKLLTILTVVLIGILLVLLQSCKKDEVTPVPPPPGPTEIEIFTGRISATWRMQRAVVDGVDVTGAFHDMSIIFTFDKTYVVSNPVSPLWPASGSFEPQKVGDSQFSIKRSDGITIDVASLTDSKMVLELFYTSTTGRTSGVTGHYKFELVR